MIRAITGGTISVLALSAVTLRECAPIRLPEVSSRGGLVAVAPDDWPRLTDDAERDTLVRAVTRSLDQIARLPAERTHAIDGRTISVADLRRTLEVFLAAVSGATPPIDWNGLLRERFELLRADTPPPLFTGYYQPELPASRERTERFRYPLYRLPDDLVDVDLGMFCEACAARVASARVKDRRLVPYFSRQEIDTFGALAGQDTELAWLDDPLEVFFLQVQGSGLLRFEDGSAMHVGVAGSNGRPYRSIGKLLVERGKLSLEAVSLQSIKQYLRDHPDEREALLNANERYIFFGPAPVGPVGSFGVPLTAGRSIAVDPKTYPLGALAFLRTERPDGAGELARFMTAQDTGAAITGPGRVDVFWGAGPDAERIAGPMRATGELYLLLAR